MHVDPPLRPPWQRALWLGAGVLSLLLGIVGIVLPVMPTVPFVLVAAFCFSHGCRRCERWMLEHRHLGPPIHNWRKHRAVPLRAKQFAIVMMAGGAAFAWWLLPEPWHWMPAACCAAVAVWLWRLPTMPASSSSSSSTAAQ